jgi:hypothetical protein
VSVGPFGKDPGDELAGATTCPHCNGVAGVSPHPRLKQVCNICGAPRIDLNDGTKLSGQELGPLKDARTAERKRIQWKVGGVFGGATSGFIFLLWMVWALIFGAGAIWAVSGLALAAPFLALALGGLAKSKSEAAAADKALRAAWKSAARDIIEAHPKGITAQTLAEKLPISVQQAEDIAAELSVDSIVASRVTEDGRLLLMSTGPSGPRIDTSEGQAIEDPLEKRFAELEQAEEEAGAGAAVRQAKK